VTPTLLKYTAPSAPPRHAVHARVLHAHGALHALGRERDPEDVTLIDRSPEPLRVVATAVQCELFGTPWNDGLGTARSTPPTPARMVRRLHGRARPPRRPAAGPWSRCSFASRCACDYGAWRDLQRHRLVSASTPRLTAPARATPCRRELDALGVGRDGARSRSSRRRARCTRPSPRPTPGRRSTSCPSPTGCATSPRCQPARALPPHRAARRPSGSPRVPPRRPGHRPPRHRPLPGFGDCDGNAANGCEADTRTSAAHCGALRPRVLPAPTPRRACAAGACAIATCAAGFGDCDGNAANGCEADTAPAAPTAAPAAGVRAPNAAAVCAGRAAASPATAGFATATATRATAARSTPARARPLRRAAARLHAPTRRRPARRAPAPSALRRGLRRLRRQRGQRLRGRAHCGGCGRVPAPANAAGGLRRGRVRRRVQRAGFGDCDGNAANGCETNLNTARRTAAAAARACARPNADAVVRGGACCARGVRDGLRRLRRRGGQRLRDRPARPASTTTAAPAAAPAPSPTRRRPARTGACAVGACTPGLRRLRRQRGQRLRGQHR
jgi:hypothetical protein